MTDLIGIAETKISNSNKLTIIAGLNVLEDDQQTVEVAGKLKKIIESQGNPFIFKASFDKANRSSVDSYRGPGLEKGLEIFKELKKSGYQLITDIHEISQVEKISEVIDIIQIPAFLCRQTDLIKEACQAGRPLNIKKGQFLSPDQMKNIATSSKHVQIVKELRQRLMKYLRETNDPRLTDDGKFFETPPMAGAVKGQRTIEQAITD